MLKESIEGSQKYGIDGKLPSLFASSIIWNLVSFLGVKLSVLAARKKKLFIAEPIEIWKSCQFVFCTDYMAPSDLALELCGW